MEQNIYESPKADLENEINEVNAELATRGSRLVAAIIDTLTILPITMPLMYFTGGFEGISEGLKPSFEYTLTMAVISTALFLGIHGKIILRDGQTWGKRFQKIKIVTINGGHANLKTLAKRYGFYWGIPQLPVVGQFISTINILFIFTKSKRCLHDRIGGTKVVKSDK